ncbi:MAG: TIGR01777 family protein, partial [SAR202 cluster bacterium]|nr:TIGR01777 family protein [SAR202 cluster bacterium]
MKVVIAGGTGLIGSALAASLAADGHDVVILTRRGGSFLPHGARLARWDGRTVTNEWAPELAGADAVVSLAGAGIGAKRWSVAYRNEILRSRVDANHALVTAMEKLPPAERPRVLVSASGADFYGDTGEREVSEEDGPGGSFLANVCVQWEAAARRAEELGVRVVLVRTAFVLGKGAEGFRKLVLPFRLFAGGALGDGRQWFSWVHGDDAAGIYRLALEQEQATGPLIAAAPVPVRQRDLARGIGRVLGRPWWLPAPEFALRLALGRQADLLLHSHRVVPAKALAMGYRF